MRDQVATKVTTTPVPTHEVRHPINLRLTQAERVELDERCTRAGMSSLSRYIRACLFGGEAPDHLEERWVGQPTIIPGGNRTRCISVRVNTGEWAILEARRARTGIVELGAYVRRAVLAQRAPAAVVPELNRVAWLTLAEQLVRLQMQIGSLEALQKRTRYGPAESGVLEDMLSSCLEELRAVQLSVQALRRGLLGSEPCTDNHQATQRRTTSDRERP